MKKSVNNLSNDITALKSHYIIMLDYVEELEKNIISLKKVINNKDNDIQILHYKIKKIENKKKRDEDNWALDILSDLKEKN
jgi:hypothetical protein